MGAGWAPATLDDVAEQITESLKPGTVNDLPYVALEHVVPGEPRIRVTGKSSETASVTTRFASGDVLFSKLRPYLNKVVAADANGCCTNEITVWRAKDTVLPGYLALILRDQRAIAYAVDLSGGTRMPRTSAVAMKRFPVQLPSLPEQRRIVDLIGSLDEAIEAADESLSLAETAWSAVGAGLTGAKRPLSDLLERIEAGTSPSAEGRPPQPDERGVLKVSAIGPRGFDPTESKTVPPEISLNEKNLVAQSDVLMVRANGVLSRVGAVCLVGETPANLYLCDKTLRLVPKSSEVDPTWLVAALQAPAARDQIAMLAGGSDMRNITQTSIFAIEIPGPPLEEQAAVAGALAAQSDAIAAASDYATSLRNLRSNLLTALLSGEHEIPESYDDLLEAAA